MGSSPGPPSHTPTGPPAARFPSWDRPERPICAAAAPGASARGFPSLPAAPRHGGPSLGSPTSQRLQRRPWRLPGLTWRVVARPQAHAAADAQVRHGVGQVAGAVAPAQAGVNGLVRVEGGGQRGGEVQVGEVGKGTARVEGRGDEGDVGGLIRGWKYAGGGKNKTHSVWEHRCSFWCPPQVARPRTYWIPGTSQERGRAEDDESCKVKEE